MHTLQAPTPSTTPSESWQSPHVSDRATVALLTLLALAARVATGGNPPLWADEAHTFRRVSGTFAELTQMLHQDAFVPLHYYLYWLLGRLLGGAEHLTPFWMRFIPAVAGGFMVPVMWLLARHVAARSTAMLVAAFTACSAFLFAYSHDAKMYMPLWLLAATNALCWLAWNRDRRALHWAGWVVSGSAMCLYHATGWIVIGAEMFHFAISHPRNWSLTAAGLALIAAGPVAYYRTCKSLIAQTQTVGWHSASGLFWVKETLQQRGAVGRWLMIVSDYLFAWEWPNGWPEPRLVTIILMTITALTLVAIAGGAFFWIARTTKAAPASAIRENTAFFVFWIFAPLVVAHELSVEAPGSPMLAAGGLCFLAAIIMVGKLLWPSIRQALHGRSQLSGTLVLTAAVVAGMGFIALGARGNESTAVWVPRYLGVIWPAVAIAICAALMRLRPLWARNLAVVVFLGANVIQCGALVLCDSEPPVDRIAADLVAAGGSGGAVLALVPSDAPSSQGTCGGEINNTVGRYYLSILTGNKLGPRGFSDASLDQFAPVTQYADESALHEAMEHIGSARRIILWQWSPDPPAAPPLSPGPRWRIVSDRSIPVRPHWNWRTSFRYRRTEFERKGQ